MRRIGFIGGGTALLRANYDGLPQGMRELGYVEGKDFVIEWRLAEGEYQRFTEFADELVRSKVDVIVLSTPAAVQTVQRATTTIPIVMGYSTDPVGNGFVASLANPGGNLTGLASALDDITPKQMELLASAVPALSRVGVLTNPGNPNASPVLRSAAASAHQAGLTLVPVEARTPHELQTGFSELIKERAGAVIVIADAFFNSQRQRLVELALEERLPTMFPQREYAVAGGLMSYGENLFEFYRRTANFVDKIFKGAKPSDLPIEQAALFKFVINRKTADSLGLTIPPQLYVFADEVLE
ncbi:MAG TPA: ABC transporter substrate-binding protein [Xanthobacteraceae bacterium]|jgi:putative ABC transport system substrate-binding protein